jgi:hypothetical protein
MRTLVLIDAFNLYYSVKGHSPRGRPRAYLWLDLMTFSKRLAARLNFGDSIPKVYYFTAVPHHMAGLEPEKINRHKLFIKAQEAAGVIVCKQSFVKQKGNTYAKIKGREERSWTEKGTDVTLVCCLFEEAIKGSFDQAIIVSNDSDYQPAIETFHRLFHGKKLAVIATPARKGDKGNHLLRKTTSYYYLIQEEDYSECQFAEEVRVSRSRSIRRPDYWN